MRAAAGEAEAARWAVDTVNAIGPLVSARNGNASVFPRRPWIGGPPPESQQSEAQDALRPNIDATDLQLLRLLQDDGRITNVCLAEAVALSPAATHDRVRRLTREGYILGYSAILDPQLLAPGLLVFVEVQVERPGMGETFRAAMHAHEDILECHEVTGGVDYLLKTRVADIHAFRDLVGSVIWRLPGVRNVRTHAVMEELKSTSRIPL